MAVRKVATKPTAAELLLADRIARAKAANPPRDPTGEHHQAMAELARTSGMRVDHLLDEWSERAACREYLGNVTRAEAERLACEDVIEAYTRQRSIAV